MKGLFSMRSRSVRSFALAVSVAACAQFAAGTAQAGNRPPDYVGGGYLTDFGACNRAGWPTRIEMFRARLTPRDDASGHATSDLVLNTAVGGVMVFTLPRQITRRRAWQRANSHTVWGSLYRQRVRPRVRILEFSDAATGGAQIPLNPEIRLSVRIRRFNDDPSCIVTAHMMLRNTQ